MSYLQDIQNGIRTTLKGLSLTLRHLRQATHRRTPEGIASANYFDQQNGLVTLQYPHEQLPIPDNGRYRLRNEIDDCIVCDKCAKVCPVDCITIEAIKATEEVGRASDGSPIRLYAATFDIDMAKCCYCGLCTVVCPTECLTMDKKFDYSEFELGKLTYSFAELTPTEADEKRALYEQFVREKEEAKAAQTAAKAAATPAKSDESTVALTPKRPVFRPTAMPIAEPSEPLAADAPETNAAPTPEPVLQVKKSVFQPTHKSISTETTPPDTETNAPMPEPEKPKARPAFRPSMKPAGAVPDVANSEDKQARKPVAEQNSAGSALAHPLTDATPDEMERIAEAGRESVSLPGGPLVPEPTPKPKPKPIGFKPTMKPTAPAPDLAEQAAPESPKPKSSATPGAFRPTMKPAKPAESVSPTDTTPAEPTSENASAEPKPTDAPKPKPAFRPTMKPITSQPKPKPDDAESD